MEIKCKEFVFTRSLEVMVKDSKFLKGSISIAGNFTIPFNQDCPVHLGDELDSLTLINYYGYSREIKEKIIITSMVVTDSETIVTFCNEFTSKLEDEFTEIYPN